MERTLKLLKERVSLRQYAEKKISTEDLNRVIESAMRAPTAGNMMAYSILVIKDEITKKTLSETCDHQPFIAKAPVLLVFLADVQRWYDYYDHCNVKEYCEKNDLDFTGPGKADLMLACSDALIAAQNAVIAAEALGIGTCYIGDIMENYDNHKELLNLSDYTFPIAMLTLGYYPDNIEKKIKPRFKKDYIVFDEKYRRLDPEEFDDMFKTREKFVVEGNKFKAENFGQLVYGAKTGSDFMKEMERSIGTAFLKWGKKQR